MKRAALLFTITALAAPLWGQRQGSELIMDPELGPLVIDYGSFGDVDTSGLDPNSKRLGTGGALVDVLVVYSKQLAGFDSPAALEEAFRDQVEDVPAMAFSRSGIPHRFRLVAAEPVSFDETTDTDDRLRDDLAWVRTSEEVAALWQLHNADIVLLALLDGENSVAGVAPVQARPDGAVAVFRSHAGNLTAAHELGHILGALHQVGAGSSAAQYTGFPRHGHFWEMPGGGTGSSIMATTVCGVFGIPCERFAVYSDPSSLQDGVPTGVDDVSNVAGLMRDVMPQVAEFSDGRIKTCSLLLSDEALCLQTGRFRVAVDWGNFDFESGQARAVRSAVSNDSGVLWFFNEENWELLVKVIDGCSFNNRFWVFFAATTNVAFLVHVEDLLVRDGEFGGRSVQYENALGNAADAVTDTNALATCDGGPGG